MKSLINIWNGLTNIIDGIISIIALFFIPFIILRKFAYKEKNIKKCEENNKNLPIEIVDLEMKGGK